jgi:hypothetical protein
MGDVFEDERPCNSRSRMNSRVSGSQVHDARVAALCLHHGVRELWTADLHRHQLRSGGAGVGAAVETAAPHRTVDVSASERSTRAQSSYRQ